MIKLLQGTKRWSEYWKERKIDWKKEYFDTWNHPHRYLITGILKDLPWLSLFEIGCGAGESGRLTLLICAGHKLGAIEYARNILGVKDATSEEFGKGTFVVKKRPALKVGLHQGETWWSNYEVDIVWEIPEHFISVPFHPEYQSSKDKPHPVLKQFLDLCKNKSIVDQHQA